jgi:hypothetical protein
MLNKKFKIKKVNAIKYGTCLEKHLAMSILGSIHGKTIRFPKLKHKPDASQLNITGDIPYNDGNSLRASNTILSEKLE